MNEFYNEYFIKCCESLKHRHISNELKSSLLENHNLETFFNLCDQDKSILNRLIEQNTAFKNMNTDQLEKIKSIL